MYIFRVLFSIIIILFLSSNAFAIRIKYSGVARDGTGSAVTTATVAVYKNGTTDAANVYAAESGGAAITSTTTDSSGIWTFWVDTTDHAYTQKFKIIVTKGTITATYSDLHVLALPANTSAATVLKNDGSGAYSWGTDEFDIAGNFSPTGVWDFSGGTLIGGFNETEDYSPTGTWTWTGATVVGLNANTATALAANGANCSVGEAARGVDASGAAEGCFTPGTISISGEITTDQLACWASSSALKSCGAQVTDNSTASHWLYKDSDGHIENAVISTGLTDTAGTLTVTGIKSGATTGQISITGPVTDTNRVKTVRDANDTILELGGGYAPTGAWDFGGATSLEIPNGSSPTIDAAGEIGIDTTTDQIRWYGTAQQQLSPKLTFSVVVPAVAATDDMLIMKAPYGMKLLALDCIVSAATSATINIQECTSTGTSCDDTATDDLACDTDGATTSTFGGTEGDTIASGAWIKLDVASISSTPGTLTVTVTYSVVAD